MEELVFNRWGNATWTKLSKGFISPAADWKRLPNLESSAFALGLPWTPNLVGRAHEIEKACNQSGGVGRVFSKASLLVFFDGIPGTGKTTPTYYVESASHLWQ